jgi:hypothetical protein
MTASIETPQADPNELDNAPEPYTMREYCEMLSRVVAMQHAPAHDANLEYYLWSCLSRQVDYADIEGLRAGNPHIDTLPLGAPYDALGVVFRDANEALVLLGLATDHRNDAIQKLLRAIQHLDAIDTYHTIISASPVMPEPIRKKRVV